MVLISALCHQVCLSKCTTISLLTKEWKSLRMIGSRYKGLSPKGKGPLLITEWSGFKSQQSYGGLAIWWMQQTHNLPKESSILSGSIRRGMSSPATVLTTLWLRVGYSLAPLQTVRMLGFRKCPIASILISVMSCEYGGIGRRIRLKICWPLRSWEFKSPYSHFYINWQAF